MVRDVAVSLHLLIPQYGWLPYLLDLFLLIYYYIIIIIGTRKYGWATGTTNDVTTRCMHVAWWISKATCMHAHAHVQALGYPHARTHRAISNA